MRTRQVGRTALRVTELGFGGAAIGGLYQAVPRAPAVDAVEAAWEAGIRYFDTAPYYGNGLSERRIGDVLQSRPRDHFVVSTKVGRLLMPAPESELPDTGYVDALPFRTDYDYGYDGIMRSVEASLHRLGLNRIDILFVHDIGVLTHGAEANAGHLRDLLDGGIRALDRLKSAGTIAAYGLGVNEVEVCLEVMARAPLDVILLAGRYSLLDRTGGADLIPRCAEAGTSLVLGGVFNSGILATGAVPGAHFNYAPPSDDVVARVRGMEAVAAEAGVPLAAAALRFALQAPAVASVLVGTAKRSSLERNMALLDVEVAPETLARFDEFAIAP